LPEFAIIGAQKAGTTSLFSYLTAGPGVLRSFTPETHFFDVWYDRGAGWYRSQFPTRALRAVAGRRAGHPAIAGENSPFYLLHPIGPARRRATLPDARLIVVLREPVDRAVSAHNHNRGLGIETATFEEAIERELGMRDEIQRLANDPEAAAREPEKTATVLRRLTYLTRGHYADQLERWFAAFPREHFLILGSGDLFADPAGALARACAFLGIPAHTLDEYVAMRAGTYADISTALRAQLDGHFAPHNERLAALLGGLPNW
jgi:hypothetical protein